MVSIFRTAMPFSLTTISKQWIICFLAEYRWTGVFLLKFVGIANEKRVELLLLSSFAKKVVLNKEIFFDSLFFGRL